MEREVVRISQIPEGVSPETYLKYIEFGIKLEKKDLEEPKKELMAILKAKFPYVVTDDYRTVNLINSMIEEAFKLLDK